MIQNICFSSREKGRHVHGNQSGPFPWKTQGDWKHFPCCCRVKWSQQLYTSAKVDAGNQCAHQFFQFSPANKTANNYVCCLTSAFSWVTCLRWGSGFSRLYVTQWCIVTLLHPGLVFLIIWFSGKHEVTCSCSWYVCQTSVFLLKGEVCRMAPFDLKCINWLKQPFVASPSPVTHQVATA